MPLTLLGAPKLGYLALWPHARPLRIARPRPMLRAVPDAASVAALVARTCLAASPEAGSPRSRLRRVVARLRRGAGGMSATRASADMLPRGTLVLAGGLVVFALAATSFVRIAGVPAAASPVAMRAQAHIAPVASRTLRFLDRADGAVVIEDVRTRETAAIIAPGEKTGFIRGVMRGLARDRRSRGIGDGPPFELTLWRDGELSLTDTATGRSVEMTAFGSTNRAAFAALLPKGPAA